MGCIGWILVGLIAGGVAKLLVPGKDRGGLIVTIIVGIGGALVGGYLGTLIGFGDFQGFDIRSLALAIGGRGPAAAPDARLLRQGEGHEEQEALTGAAASSRTAE